MSLCPWAVTSTCVSHFLSLPLSKAEQSNGLDLGVSLFPCGSTGPTGVGISISQDSEALIISKQVRLWLTSVPWGQALLGTRVLPCISKWLLLPFHPRSTRRFVSDNSCRYLVSLLEVNLTVLWDSPQDCLHWACSNSSNTIQVFLPSPGFCSWVSAPENCDTLHHLSVVQSWDSSLPCVLTSLMYPARVVDFSVCSAFHLLCWVVTPKLLTKRCLNQQKYFV